MTVHPNAKDELLFVSWVCWIKSKHLMDNGKFIFSLAPPAENSQLNF